MRWIVLNSFQRRFFHSKSIWPPTGFPFYPEYADITSLCFASSLQYLSWQPIAHQVRDGFPLISSMLEVLGWLPISLISLSRLDHPDDQTAAL